MAGRVKSQDELEREQADARLARQLMEEEETAYQRQQQQQQHMPQQQHQFQQQQPPRNMPQQTIPASSALQVMCPTCLSINNIHPANMHLHHMCGTCRRVLPNRSEQLQNAQGNLLGGTSLAPHQQAPPQQPGTATLRCQHCRADNIVPNTGGAFKCGQCGIPLLATINNGAPQQHIVMPHQQQQQPAPMPQQQPVQQQQAPPQAPRQAPILQAQAVEEGPRNLEVRCGRCPAINTVPEDPRTPGTIQFKCGSCNALNKASY